MLHLRTHLRFHFSEHIKMNEHFTLQLMIHLTIQSRGAPEGTFDAAPKNALSMMDACKVALKSAFQVALELYLCLNLLKRCLMHKWYTFI